MRLPEVLHTDRLRLPLWTREDVDAIRAGERRSGWHRQFPREDDVDAASLWREGDPWSSRSIVHGGLVVGSIGFFGPPEASDDHVPEVEVGYGLVEDARGQGIATEALHAVLAVTDLARVRVRARVRPGNAASIRALASCGFSDLRGSTQDGELVMARPLR